MLQDVARLERDLWEAADQLRANSNLPYNEYFMPVLGVIFLRHAANRFDVVRRQIDEDQAAGRMPKRKAVKADYVRRRALWLPPKARFDNILSLPTGADFGQALIDAMNAIEEDFQPLKGVLPKDYSRFDNDVLEDLLRIFNRETIRTASGDVFGRIYEYFLMQFADKKAHDNGEFFTPPSLVQTIVNVIEPEHGTVFDPACGSGGMFVQSSHFIERLGFDTAKRVVFYGQEKTATTIRLAQMNLAVHGLEGGIREANTYYEDVHTLAGKCDFVMANPPFNVDMVDAEKVEGDKRLPFGLPGVNKQKKVSNGNYLWISYFWSYLGEKGRAGFVMSSQASSAGRGEKEVRRKIVEAGDVDVMIAIRSNFFYTRTVPCELWFFDRGRPKQRRDKVLMLDARNVYRKVTRKIYDFSPEQLSNLSAIVWLYRGQTDRFLALVEHYLGSICAECSHIPPAIAAFDKATETVVEALEAFREAVEGVEELDGDKPKAFAEAFVELTETTRGYCGARDKLLSVVEAYRKRICKTLPKTNAAQHKAREAFNPIADTIRGLIKQADLIYKLAARARDAAFDLGAEEYAADHVDRRGFSKLVKQLDDMRKAAVEQLKLAAYFYKHVVWLQDRFPDARFRSVVGLVKVVDGKEIEKADWSLSPGRYVGVAPAKADENFDFEEALSDIHVELAGLNEEAAGLSRQIQANIEELF